MQLAYDSLREYIQRKINEKKQTANFQIINGINDRQALILKWIYQEPEIIFSVREIENRFIVSNQTARTDLIQLVERGYLQMTDVNKKKKSFYKSPYFEEVLKNDLPENDLKGKNY